MIGGPSFGQLTSFFNSESIALVGDIEKAFLMVSVSEQDRDALIFLWIDEAKMGYSRVIDLRFTRVVFGVSASLYLLLIITLRSTDRVILNSLRSSLTLFTWMM